MSRTKKVTRQLWTGSRGPIREQNDNVEIGR